jgi:hypothetical protein
LIFRTDCRESRDATFYPILGPSDIFFEKL